MYKFTIDTVEGKKEQKGVKVGEYFAVSPIMQYGGGIAAGYNITHLPTGCSIDYFTLATYAVKCCKALALVANWNRQDNLFTDEEKQAIGATLQKFQELDYVEASARFGWANDDEDNFAFLNVFK